MTGCCHIRFAIVMHIHGRKGRWYGMEWIAMYGKGNAPTFAQIDEYIDNPMWTAFGDYMGQAYDTQPKLAYSGCSGQPGWNVKYQKGGKSLCTLYPMEGYFIALVVVGEKERTEAELLLPTLTAYTREKYGTSGALMGARWLMLSVTDEAVLQDVRTLIGLRRRPKA